MALSPAELAGEELGQLHRLAQSPGWALFSSRVRKQVASNEQAKARALREGQTQGAMSLQGRVDGLTEALALLDVAISELQSKVTVSEEMPVY